MIDKIRNTLLGLLLLTLMPSAFAQDYKILEETLPKPAPQENIEKPATNKELLREILIEVLKDEPINTEAPNSLNEEAADESPPSQEWVLSSYVRPPQNSNIHQVISTISGNISTQIESVKKDWGYFFPQLKTVGRKLTSYKGSEGVISLLSYLASAILFGLILERIVNFSFKRKKASVYAVCNTNSSYTEVLEKNQDNNPADNLDDESTFENEILDFNSVEKKRLEVVDKFRVNIALKLKSVFSLFVIDMLRLGAFAIGALLIPFVLIGSDTFLMKDFIIAIICQIIIFSFFVLFFRTVMQPGCSYLRLMSLEDSEARSYYMFVIVVFFIDTFGISSIHYWVTWGVELKFLLLPVFVLSAVLNLYVFFHIWRSKTSIQKIFVNRLDDSGKPIIGRMTILYPWLITFGVLIIWTHWFYFFMLQDFHKVKLLGISWFILLFYPIIDRGFFIITSGAVSLYKGNSLALRRRITRIIKNLLISLRYFLALAIIYFYISAIDISKIDVFRSILGEVLTEISIIVALSYVLWEATHGYIEHKFPEDESALASLEGDGGGAGASRSETIMPIIRSFLTFFLVVLITLTSLHAFGVQIAPLLAGAGIVGIAIGFGAQKLVQDILSGIFFLVDDAFRKGEYIEIEELRGTVEKIAMRSMQLRHHLGAVQTIPYGEIKTVKNLSRDWITMKLEIRLPYNTDIEKVRKIIKKVGQKMLQDPELGPSFILPLKSQGVMRVEESALIIRMKFTTKPGEQWVVRREAYRNVKDALAENNIHFAHREVFVRLPDEQAKQLEDITPEERLKLKEVAAAAATGIIADEALKNSKIQSDDDGHGSLSE